MQSGGSRGLCHPPSWCWRLRPAEQRGYYDGSFEATQIEPNDHIYSNFCPTAAQLRTSRLPSLWQTMRLKLTLPCSFRELPAELSQYTVLPAEAAKRGAQWALPVPIPRRES
jgi:hypothetical protein